MFVVLLYYLEDEINLYASLYLSYTYKDLNLHK